jgi:phosphatidylglycerol---prolipoprotein diacylglyceryl transferase
MLPVLYQADWGTIYTHDFFSVMGLLAGLAVYYVELHRRKLLSDKIFWISICAVFGGGIGARLITAWEHLPYYSQFGEVPFTYLIAHSGKSIIGAIAGGYLAIAVSKKALRYTISTGDCYAPAIPLALAIGRIGCYLAELPLGIPTDLPWGVRVPAEARAFYVNCAYCDQPMHPTMIYEIIFHLLALALILRWRSRVMVNGDTLKLYLLAAALFRFGVDFLRGNTEQFWGLTGPQIVLIPLTIPLVVHFIRQWRSGVYRMPDPPRKAEIMTDQAA